MLHPQQHFKPEAEYTCFKGQHRQAEQCYESATGLCKTPSQRSTLVKQVRANCKELYANTTRMAAHMRKLVYAICSSAFECKPAVSRHSSIGRGRGARCSVGL